MPTPPRAGNPIPNDVGGRSITLDADTTRDLVQLLMRRVVELEALLARVRSYAVVDPLGNPSVLAAARMTAIERDIETALDQKSCLDWPGSADFVD